MKNIKNNPDFLAMVEVMKDNAHCPAHRNCEKCVYATDDTMCSLMIKAEKLIKAGFRYQPYDVGDTVYVAMKFLPTPKRMKITDIHYCKFSWKLQVDSMPGIQNWCYLYICS